MKIQLICEKCGKLFEKFPSEIKGNKHYYCCRKCANDSKKNKPDASPVFKSLENTDIKINPKNVWIIGDSNQDIDCGYNAGIQPILYGKGKLAEAEYFKEKMKAIPPMQQIMHFKEIIEIF